jgi:hemerythrin-like metal-binding protein/PAS domain S-box-containing protein
MTSERYQRLYLICIMIAVALGVGALSLYFLYQASFEKSRRDLINIAQSGARTIEAVARFDKQYSSDYSGGALEATMSQIREAHNNFEWFGETGEYILAKKEKDQIQFLLRHRHSSTPTPTLTSIPLDSTFAEPMRKALKRESGSIIGLDYRGKKVLAAFEPVAELNLGLVAKVDLSEVRAPFIKAGLIAGGGGLVIILLGIIVFIRTSEPLIRSLREREERLKLALDGSGGLTWDWNIQSGDIVFSQKWFTSLGYEQNEFEHNIDTWKKLIHPDDVTKVMDELEDHFKRNTTTYQIEYRLLKKDGAYDWHLDTGRVVEWNDKREPIRMVGVDRNINNRKKSEQELYTSHNMNKSILGASGEGIYGLDLNGHTTFVNPAAEHMLGYSLKEMKDHSQHDLIHHSKSDGTPYPRKSCKIYAALNDGQIHHVSDEVFWRKDGTSFPVDYVSTPMIEDGKIKGAVVTFKDITDRLKSERELEDYRHHLEELVESKSKQLEKTLSRSKSYFEMPLVGLLVSSPDNKFIEVNDRMCLLLGYSKEELLEKSWVDITHPGDRDRNLRVHSEMLSGKTEKYQIEKRYIKKGGEYLEAEVAVGCIRKEDGSPDYTVGMIQDITQRKKYEKEKEHLSKLKTDFLSTAAHELRTPLTTIRGYSELMRDKDSLSSDVIKKFSGFINNESEHLTSIINDLLDISKIEAGNSFALNMGLASLVDCAKDSATLFTAQDIKNKFPFEISGEPYEILIDPIRVQQIFRNLYSNSVKYAEPGCEIITKIEFKDDAALVSVADKGKGMTNKQVEHIFDKFYRTEEVKNIQGTGLGMGIVEHLVKSHAGKIWVESEVDKGTIVSFELPRYSPVWRDEFSVKIPSIDDQHKELFSLIGKLAQAIRENNGKETVELVLSELIGYTEFHFKYEEDLFQKYNYPDSKNHIKTHKYFRERIEGFKYVSESEMQHLPTKLIGFLYNWLTTHILKEDMAYSPFLAQKMLKNKDGLL